MLAFCRRRAPRVLIDGRPTAGKTTSSEALATLAGAIVDHEEAGPAPG